MRPATQPRHGARQKDDERLLRIDPSAAVYADTRVRDLPGLLRTGDLVVVNDAATLPASLSAQSPTGHTVEVRLLRQEVAAVTDDLWQVVVLGQGDWRTPTERRPAPEALGPGCVLRISAQLSATVERVSALSPRFLHVRFNRSGAALWTALYHSGRPVQYAYLQGPIELWSVQTSYGSRPWAVEMPSAGRPLHFGLIAALRGRGIGLGTLTHAAGLSSTGDPAIDAALPLPEHFDIPQQTVDAIAQVRRSGGRVIAVGTSVVRALEGCAVQHGGRAQAGPGETALRIGKDFRPQIVSGLLTGLHEPTASHFDLLQAFVPLPLLQSAYRHAETQGYLCHEFGDSSLILPN